MDYNSSCLYLVVWIVYLVGTVTGNSTTSTTKKPNDLKQTQNEEEDEGFPAWAIGVIILSTLAVIILVATIVQRLLRRRANRQDGYSIRS